MRRILPLCLLLVAALFALSGCGGDDDDGGNSVASFCEEFEAADASGDPLEDIDPGDIDGAKDALAEFEETISGLADAAPDQISDDVNELADYMSSYNEAITDVDSEEELQQVREQCQEDNPSPDPAVERLETFTDENCDTGGDTTG